MADWRTVWAYVDARRVELGMNKKQLEAATDVSEKSYRLMRTQGIGLTRAEKLVTMCDGLLWTHRSIALILAGGTPEVIEGRQIDPVKQLASIERKVDELMDLLAQVARRVLRDDGRTHQ